MKEQNYKKKQEHQNYRLKLVRGSLDKSMTRLTEYQISI